MKIYFSKFISPRKLWKESYFHKRCDYYMQGQNSKLSNLCKMFVYILVFKFCCQVFVIKGAPLQTPDKLWRNFHWNPFLTVRKAKWVNKGLSFNQNKSSDNRTLSIIRLLLHVHSAVKIWLSGRYVCYRVGYEPHQANSFGIMPTNRRGGGCLRRTPCTNYWSLRDWLGQTYSYWPIACGSRSRFRVLLRYNISEIETVKNVGGIQSRFCFSQTVVCTWLRHCCRCSV